MDRRPRHQGHRVGRSLVLLQLSVGATPRGVGGTRLHSAKKNEKHDAPSTKEKPKRSEMKPRKRDRSRKFISLDVNRQIPNWTKPAKASTALPEQSQYSGQTPADP